MEFINNETMETHVKSNSRRTQKEKEPFVSPSTHNQQIDSIENGKIFGESPKRFTVTEGRIQSRQSPRQRCSIETKQNWFGGNIFMGLTDRQILWDRNFGRETMRY